MSYEFLMINDVRPAFLSPNTSPHIHISTLVTQPHTTLPHYKTTRLLDCKTSCVHISTWISRVYHRTCERMKPTDWWKDGWTDWWKCGLHAIKESKTSNHSQVWGTNKGSSCCRKKIVHAGFGIVSDCVLSDWFPHFFSLDVFFCWLLSLHVGVSLSVSVCLPVYFCQSFWFERSGHKTITYQRLREQTTVADHTDRLTDRTKRLLAQKKCRNCHHECQSRLLKQSADGMASKRHISKSFGDHKFSVIFFPFLQKSPLSVSRCHSVFFSFFLAFVCFWFRAHKKLFRQLFWLVEGYFGWLGVVLVGWRLVWLVGNCFGWLKVVSVGCGLFWLDKGCFGWLGVVLVGWGLFWLVLSYLVDWMIRPTVHA